MTKKSTLPRTRTTLHTPERVMFVGDVHIPVHEPRVVKTIVGFAKHFKPTKLFLIGDILDFASLSTFDVDVDQQNSLQDELDQGREVLSWFREAVGPKTDITYIDGNHEYRVLRYIQRHKELASWNGLQIPQLLKLSDFKIKHVGYHDQSIGYKGVHIEHGDRSSSKSGYTAYRMLDARWHSGISGHTHRLSSVYKTPLGRKHYFWHENGCACRMDLPYLKAPPDWQWGFSVGFGHPKRGTCLIQPVPIVDYEIVFNSQYHVLET